LGLYVRYRRPPSDDLTARSLDCLRIAACHHKAEQPLFLTLQTIAQPPDDKALPRTQFTRPLQTHRNPH